MARNKVIFGDEVLLDLTADTVTPETLARGETAHDKAGETIVGTADLLVTEEQSGESLAFEAAMGGVAFVDERGLRVVGKTAQDSLSGKNLASQAVEAGFWNAAGGEQVWDGCCRVPAIELDAYEMDMSGGVTITSNLPILQYSLVAESTVVDSLSYTNTYNLVWIDTDTGERRQTLYITLAGSVSDFEWVQVELGENATEYEPYCGGIPAPNPAYPLPVRCAKEGSRVRVRGKNLWAYPAFGTQTYAGVTFEARADGILVNGTSTSSISYKSTDITADLMVDVSYVASVRGDNLPSGVYPYFVVTSSEGTKYLTKFTMAEDVSKVLLYISISKGKTFSGALILPQYEVGTTATAFEPYVAPHDLVVPCDLYEGDVWYPASGRVEKHMGIIQLDQNSNVQRNNPLTSSSWLFYMELKHDTSSRGLSTHFRHGAWGSAKGTFSLVDNANVLYFNLTNYITTYSSDAAKEWLEEQKMNGVPVTVCYKLANPTTEQYAAQYLPIHSGTLIVEQIPVEETATLGMTVVTA